MEWQQQQQHRHGGRRVGKDESMCVYEFASFIVMEFQEIKLMNNKKFWWQVKKMEGNGDRLSGLHFEFVDFCSLSLYALCDDNIANGNYFIVIRRHRRHVIKFSVNLNASNV